MKAQIEYRPETLHEEVELTISPDDAGSVYLFGSEAIEAFDRLGLDEVTPVYQTEYCSFYEMQFTRDFYDWLVS